MCGRVRTIIALLVSIYLILPASASRAESDEIGLKLFAATKVDDQRIDELVISLLNTYLVLKEGVVLDRALENGREKVNFYYASGANFIAGERISTNALTPFFDEMAMADIAQLPTNSEACWVQSVVFADGQRIVLAVHNDNVGDAEDVFRCLTAGLWKFEARELSKLDVVNWRISMMRLFYQTSN